MRAQQLLGVTVLGVATAVVLLAAGTARAGLLQVTFHEAGFSDVTITDRIGGVGDPNDLNPVANQILALIPANFTDYSGSVSVSSNNPGTAALGTLNLNPNVPALTGAAAGASPLIITATQTGFSLPGGLGSTLKLTSTLAVSGLTSGTVGLTGSIDSTSTPPQSLSAPGTNTQNLTHLIGATYSLTAQTSITLSSSGDSANFSATENTALVAASAVPEPSSLALLTLGGFGLAVWRRWKGKRRQNTPAA
jgi:hypothetical protein